MMFGEGKQRLWSLLRRARQGEELVIGFLGGSITQGSLASSTSFSYPAGVMRWWKKQFPQACFHYVNAGIGGTTSHFGAARVWDDLLMYRPDLVVVDFSVNDEAEPLFEEAYEGLLRRIFYSGTKPAVILLHNVYYDSGKTAEEIHGRIGDHYGVPRVSIRDTIYRRLCKKEYELRALTPDGLHPNDYGHMLVADEITAVLEEAQRSMDEEGDGTDEEKILPPLTENRFENAARLTIQNAVFVSEGFRADSAEKQGHLDLFKNGWNSRREGAWIRFTLPEASCIALQYRKTIRGAAPKAVCMLDGLEETAVLLDGEFEERWGDCLFLQPVLMSTQKENHTLELRITEVPSDTTEDFYLVSVILGGL